MSLQAIKYDKSAKTLSILDQLRLPYESVYVSINTTRDGFQAIKSMKVRGAPAIAIVAMLSLAVEMNHANKNKMTSRDLVLWIEDRLNYLITSRPTAVNLAQAALELKNQASDALKSGLTAVKICETITDACEAMLSRDVENNKAIGRHGLNWLKRNLLDQENAESLSILTLCNTGSLATAGYGTALGIIRSVHEDGLLKRAYALETRPYNQGSRLTSYELVHDHIPATLVTDSMASSLLRQHPEIKAVVVGADRVAKNGDTANKIGTYQLAIVARYHSVKFIVAAPTTSIDPLTLTGKDITVEERPSDELTQVRGQVINDDEECDARANANSIRTVSIAAPGIDTWNPAFDITPAELVDVVVTENGAYEKDGQGKFCFV